MGYFQNRLNDIQWEEKALRRECSRLCAIANKRIDRLEASGLDSPALESWEENGMHRFSVRYKSYAEVQSEYWRVVNFLDNKTSTVTGTKDVINEMAINIGLLPVDKHVNSIAELISLQAQARTFFDIASKVKQYLKNTSDGAMALDYQAIWDKINMYIHEDNADINDSELDVTEIDSILNQMIGLETEEVVVGIMAELEKMTETFFGI